MLIIRRDAMGYTGTVEDRRETGQGPLIDMFDAKRRIPADLIGHGLLDMLALIGLTTQDVLDDWGAIAFEDGVSGGDRNGALSALGGVSVAFGNLGMYSAGGEEYWEVVIVESDGPSGPESHYEWWHVNGDGNIDMVSKTPPRNWDFNGNPHHQAGGKGGVGTPSSSASATKAPAASPGSEMVGGRPHGNLTNADWARNPGGAEIVKGLTKHRPNPQDERPVRVSGKDLRGFALPKWRSDGPIRDEAARERRGAGSLAVDFFTAVELLQGGGVTDPVRGDANWERAWRQSRQQNATSLYVRHDRLRHALVARALVRAAGLLFIAGTFVAACAPRSPPSVANAEASCGSSMAHIRGGQFVPARADTLALVLVRDFCLDRIEVTAKAYASCIAAGRCPLPKISSESCNLSREDRKDHPINCVSWIEADAFCKASHLRLPSAHEWEWAARAGSRAWRHPFGNDAPVAPVCWKQTSTCPAGASSGDRSPDSVFDLAGNVWEWVAAAPDITDRLRTRMGGAFVGDFALGSASYANRGEPEPHALQAYFYGFRCASDPKHGP